MNRTNAVYEKCPICSYHKLKSVYGNEHFLVKCLKCKTVFSKFKPSVSELKEYYSSYPSYNSISELTVTRYHEILDRLEQFRKTNNLLETGCGNGHFLEEARKRKWNVFGTEYSDAALKVCNEKNLSVTDSLEEIYKKAVNPFDVIVSIEVIEHLSDPLHEINMYSKILRNGGGLFITTPNFNSASSKILKNKWNVLLYPEHLFYFTVQSIGKLLRRNNFENIHTTTSGFSLSRMRMVFLSEEKKNNYDYNENDRQISSTIENNLILKIAKSAINKILSLINSGDTLKVLYRKK